MEAIHAGKNRKEVITMTSFWFNLNEVLMSLGEFFSIKVIFSVLAAIAAYLVGADHFSLLLALTVLVVFDAITGTYAVFKEGKPIESKIALRTPIKWTMYILMISGGHLCEMLLPGEWYLAEVTIAFLAVTEFISILENIGRSGYAIPLILLNRLQKFKDGQ